MEFRSVLFRSKSSSPILVDMFTRLRSSTRIRSKNQLNMSTKIGDEDLTDEQIAENANAVISAVEKRLPQGDKNLRNTIIKFTMGKAIKMNSLNKQAKSESA